MTLITLLLALLMDWRWGEVNRFHPLVSFGNLAHLLEKNWNNYRQQTPALLKSAGIVAVALLVVLPAIGLHLLTLEASHGWWLPIWLIELVGLYFCLGRQSLNEHALAIYQPLKAGNLAEARQQIARIVSRQTDSMSSVGVTKATVESVLENSNDACFATIFWFCLGGLPLALMHRLSNTLDAMWGYRTERFNHFGWAAAKLDDLLNWLPARLGAISLAVLGHRDDALRCWKTQAHLYDSPNGGVIMSAGAGALNIQLGGDAIYNGQWKKRTILGCGREVIPADIPRSLNLMNQAVGVWLLIIALLEWLF